ncbi:MAG: hypothetical protein MUC89_12365 [Acetobacteraceae bacterium]|jgi:hypothetical protein|nr:hypothetical protein [Acetobacteraceae bacterium]
MAERHYLIVARDAEAQARLSRQVRAKGGMVLVSLPSRAIVARLDDATKDDLAGSSDVRHCGAIEISPRPIRRIRVGPGGARVTA